MKAISILIYYLILKALLQNGCTKKQSKICLFDNVERNFNKNYVSSYNISIRHDKITLDFDIEMLKNIRNDIWCRISVMKCAENYKQCNKMFRYDVNTCKLLGKDTEKYNMLHYWAQVSLKYGNLPKKCPIEKGFYSWHNLRPFKDNIPQYLLRGFYWTNVLFYKRKQDFNVTIVNTTVTARLR